jgi:hypothetical protein
MLDEIRKIVAVDPEFISENFKTALKDGHDTIEALRSELNKTIKESADIKQKLSNTEASLLLEKKTKDLSPQKKQFMMKFLEGKKVGEIEANFKYVTEMFDKDETEKIETETTKVTTQVDPKKYDVPKQVIVEKKETDAIGEYSYINDIVESMKSETHNEKKIQ